MGAVNITNVVGLKVTINSFVINGTKIFSGIASLPFGRMYATQYNAKPWSQFQGMVMEITLDNCKYKVDLNKDHYFGGGDFHYPGDGSEVSYVLLGANSDATQIQMRLAYGQAGANRLLYSNDAKYLDRQSGS